MGQGEIIRDDCISFSCIKGMTTLLQGCLLQGHYSELCYMAALKAMWTYGFWRNQVGFGECIVAIVTPFAFRLKCNP